MTTAMQAAPLPLPIVPILPRDAGAVIDPADLAALREYLDRYGTFTPDPRDPPWADPRPDLVDDHSRWWVVLEAAWRLDGQDPHGVYGALNGMRCCGARLEIVEPATRTRPTEGQPTSWRLVRGDELTEEAYQRYRQTYLVPHTAVLTRLLSAPMAASIAHARPAQPPTLTGQKTKGAAASAPRKNRQDPAAQPALLEVAPTPAPLPGGEW